MNRELSKDDLERQIRAALRLSVPTDREAARVLEIARGRLRHARLTKIWLRCAMLAGVVTIFAATLGIIMSRTETAQPPHVASPTRELPMHIPAAVSAQPMHIPAAVSAQPKNTPSAVSAQLPEQTPSAVSAQHGPPKPTGPEEPAQARVGANKQMSARPVDHVPGAALRISACPTDLDDGCLKQWQVATIRERLTIAKKLIVEAATKTERGAADVRSLLGDQLISQLFAHYESKPDDRITASSRPRNDSMDIPLGFLQETAEGGAQKLAIHRYSPQVFATMTQTQFGHTESFVIDMDNPPDADWKKVNSFIVSSSAADVQNPAAKNLGAGYAVHLTLRPDRDLVLDIPVGTILIGDNDHQPLVVTAVDLVKRENFTNEYAAWKHHGLSLWRLGFPADRDKSIRLEGHCLIESLAPPDGVRYRFSGWKLRPEVMKKLEDSPEKQQFVWETINAMLNVVPK